VEEERKNRALGHPTEEENPHPSQKSEECGTRKFNPHPKAVPPAGAIQQWDTLIALEEKKNRAPGHPRVGNQTKNPALERRQGRGTRRLAAIALLELASYKCASGMKKPAA
jgi:hypothetical protein